MSPESAGGMHEADIVDMPFLGFPRVLSAEAAIAAHVHGQLRQHAAMPPDRQEEISLRQRQLLLSHARQHSPFWRDRLPALDLMRAPAEWQRVPILRRPELQAAGVATRAYDATRKDVAVSTAHTSGSTGLPVTIERLSAAYRPIYRAVADLEKRWHGIDPRADRGILRDVADGDYTRRHARVSGQGRVLARNAVEHSPQALLAWLREVATPYVVTLPSLAGRLARLACDDGLGPRIAKILTFGEAVTAEQRRLCGQAFGARLVDRYSCEEVGWIALQCPRHDHLHLLSSLVHMEIVDSQGQPCGIGQPGEVLITGLQSYAAPLIRYAIGDIAEWGAPCDCGITLPVVRRILGRRRNFVRMPDGTERLARLAGDRWHVLPKVQEFRLVQYSDDVIEAFLCCAAPLTAVEREAAVALIQSILDAPFRVAITETARIDWGGRQKREEFVRVDRPWPGESAPAG